jgi:hypothetical protein
MMKMKWTVLLIFSITLASCGRGTEEVADSYDSDNFFVVDYESILDNPEMVLLSDLASGIEYIKLETNDNCLLHPRADYQFTKDYIFVDNKKFILQFDRQGNFIKQIGKYGRGPGEIGLIRILSVIDEEQLLVVHTNWARKLYFFNYDGEFVENRKVDDVMNIVARPGGQLILYDYCANGYEDYMFMLVNSQGDTTAVVKNHYKWENKTGGVMTVGYHLFYPFYFYGGDSYLKSMYNDTVYHARGDSITPEYLVDLGGFKLPQDYRPEVPGSAFQENCKGYRFVNSFEARDKLFIASSDFSGGGRYNMIYDRRNAGGHFLVDEDNFESEIINDIDGGLDFWPRAAANDSILFMPVPPHQFMSGELEKRIRENDKTDPEQKAALLDMIADLSENDNPVLMLVYLK